MTTVALAALIILGQDPAQTKTFVTSDRLLEMQIPKDWKVEKERTRQIVSFKTPEGTVKIEVYATKYVQPAEDWQALQRTVNEQMKRTIVRQWDEEIMAVPMLFTSIKYTETREGDLGVLIGLLYSNTADKFHFRLVSPLASMENAEGAWRSALLTMRTSSGKPPKTEDGNPDSTDDVKPISEGNTLNLASHAPKPKPLGPVKVAFSTSGRDGVLRLPKGAEVLAESPVKVKWSGLEGIELTLHSNDDSPASALFLMQEVNKDLDRFKSVALRENFGPKRNAVGVDVLTVVRTGVNDAGNLQSIFAVVDNGKFYVVLRSERTDASVFKKHQDALLKLVNQIGFE